MCVAPCVGVNRKATGNKISLLHRDGIGSDGREEQNAERGKRLGQFRLSYARARSADSVRDCPVILHTGR